LSIEGYYEPGYLYGNPKIHKRLIDPPLRPTISQIGTVTYSLAKYLNSIITQYMPKQRMVESTYEFLSLLRATSARGMLASLDVDNLFTNVPVAETIRMILSSVYNHPTLNAPSIPITAMEELLMICTTETPFRNIDGELYVQREGVSMGSPLGPTFANYYMCNLENSILCSATTQPLFYCRYVDDIFLIVNKYHELENIRATFQSKSVLKFTYEIEVDKKIPFLDVLINRKSHQLTTSVYVKGTNSGDCLNFNSICPERYKTGVIRALLHRGYHVSNNWSVFAIEIDRIKRLLTNNNYPMHLIDSTVQKFLSSKVLDERKDPPGSNIDFYFRNQMTSSYKTEEKRLRKIIEDNVAAAHQDDKVSLIIYYKNRKLKNLLIKNKPLSSPKTTQNRDHVVYQYNCNLEGCSAGRSYIGYTTCSIWERFKMHTQTGSIVKHLAEQHAIHKPSRKQLVDKVTILKSCKDKRDLIYTEAVLIKELRPQLNSQNEGCDRILKLFVH